MGERNKIYDIKEMMRFAFSGTAGFLVDAGIVTLCTHVFELAPIPAQFVAFVLAVTVTLDAVSPSATRVSTHLDYYGRRKLSLLFQHALAKEVESR